MAHFEAPQAYAPVESHPAPGEYVSARAVGARARALIRRGRERCMVVGRGKLGGGFVSVFFFLILGRITRSKRRTSGIIEVEKKAS